MKQRFTEEQITYALKKALEEENRQLKRSVLGGPSAGQ